MSIVPLTASGVSLVIESTGAHKFSYTKIQAETGEMIWRWPNEPPPHRDPLDPLGQFIDLHV